MNGAIDNVAASDGFGWIWLILSLGRVVDHIFVTVLYLASIGCVSIVLKNPKIGLKGRCLR